MSVSVNPPKTPVTAGSNGVAAATLPNVCKMPGPPAPFVPTPLPNIGKSSDSPKGYSTSVKIGGKKVAIRGATFGSTGDMASKGTGGGLLSSNTHGPTKFLGPGSMDVKIEGKNVHLLSDPMLNNCGPSGSPANSATMVGVLQACGLMVLAGDELCPLCNKNHDEAGKLEETVDTKGDADTLAAAAKRAVEKATTVRNQRLEAARAEARAKAEAEVAAERVKLQGHIAAATASGKLEAVAKLQARLAALQPSVKEPIIPEVGLSRMLGVVRCKDGKVYAGTSSVQVRELGEEMPGGWHTPPASYSLNDASEPAFVARPEAFSKFVGDEAAFLEEWDDLEATNRKFRSGDVKEPHYPPGRCAAQQMLLLALEHGGRPVGLTERWFVASNADAKVSVYVRDELTSPPRMADFGGKDAVPPCGTCQVILTMLMCNVPAECEHRSPAEGVCRCT